MLFRSKKPRFHPHNILFIFYESHFQVQADIFVEVPGGIMLFRPVGMTDLENSLEAAADHNLFVELRALSQIGLTLEILHRKELRPSFGPGSDYLGSLNFGKILLAKKFPEGPDNFRLHLEDSPDVRIP